MKKTIKILETKKDKNHEFKLVKTTWGKDSIFSIETHYIKYKLGIHTDVFDTERKARNQWVKIK